MRTGLTSESIVKGAAAAVDSPEKSALTEQRRTLRKQLIEQRMALSPDEIERLSEKIRLNLQQTFPHLACLRVAFCWPVKNEVDLRPLMAAWISAGAPGFKALLPVVIAPGAPLAFREWAPDCAMTIDRYGIPTPETGDYLTPEALLIPVNAFDEAGYRIGYGGGFFDRTLAALTPVPLSIGIGFELARVATIHPEAHDIRLDAVVSEAGTFRPAA
jgi:5-formyltetrahydrofolate cyclo-ligase